MMEIIVFIASVLNIFMWGGILLGLILKSFSKGSK
jgi:hypothetical protein